MEIQAIDTQNSPMTETEKFYLDLREIRWNNSFIIDFVFVGTAIFTVLGSLFYV